MDKLQLDSVEKEGQVPALSGTKIDSAPKTETLEDQSSPPPMASEQMESIKAVNPESTSVKTGTKSPDSSPPLFLQRKEEGRVIKSQTAAPDSQPDAQAPPSFSYSKASWINIEEDIFRSTSPKRKISQRPCSTVAKPAPQTGQEETTDKPNERETEHTEKSQKQTLFYRPHDIARSLSSSSLNGNDRVMSNSSSMMYLHKISEERKKIFSYIPTLFKDKKSEVIEETEEDLATLLLGRESHAPGQFIASQIINGRSLPK